MPQQPRRVVEKRYLVAIPVPSLDINGRPLDKAEIDKWVKKTLNELTECFGGAMPITAPGTNILDRQILYEKDQVVILSACDSRKAFLRHRRRIEAFAEEMRRELRQYAVFVLACPSDSFLVEIASGPEGSP
ncbi:MAG: hypothetical protein HY657_16985 [Acidobacteria bacterium]|nr:hypothetical protein [Acidobacteriota bacterium]